MQRVRVFVDFWNFHLSIRRMCRLPLRVAWNLFGLRVAQAVSNIAKPSAGISFRCEGTHIYGSYSSSIKWQRELAKDMVENHALETGLFPIFEKREKLSGRRTCDHCGKSMTLEQELGIDVRLATDVIKMSNYEPDTIIVLASNDGDFIPLVDYLSDLGRKVVHLRPKEGNNEISRRSWGSVYLEQINRDAFPFENTCFLIYIPDRSGYTELQKVMNTRGVECEAISIENTKESEMELRRLFADNQAYNENFRELPKGDPAHSLNGIEKAMNLAKKRPDLMRGPFVLFRGQILNRKKIEAVFGLKFES